MVVPTTFTHGELKVIRQNRDMIRAAVATKGSCRCGETKQVVRIRTKKTPIGDRVLLECPKRRWWNQLAHDKTITILHY